MWKFKKFYSQEPLDQRDQTLHESNINMLNFLRHVVYVVMNCKFLFTVSRYLLTFVWTDTGEHCGPWPVI